MTSEPVRGRGRRAAGELLDRARQTLDRVEAAGVDEAEVYLWLSRSHTAMHTGRLRTAGSSDGSGASIRALDDGRVAFAKTSGLRDTDLGWVADQVLSSVQVAPDRSHFTGFPEPAGKHKPPAKLHEELTQPDPDQLIVSIEEAEAAATATPSIDYFQAGLANHWGLFAVVNSQGVEVWDHHAHQSMILELRARRGDRRKIARSAVYDRAPLRVNHDLADIAGQAAARADSAIQAKHLETPVQTVILDVQAAAILLGHLKPSFVGRAALEGRTAFSDRLGERVATEGLTLVDRPHGPGGCRQQRVDDEGTPTQEIALIEDGVLSNYVFDWSGALETDRRPTGHGYRPLMGRYASSPGPRIANLHVEPGGWTLEEMIADTDEAVLVRDALMGDFTLNHTTGDFSCVAPLAFHVENGKITRPLVSTTVAGNLFDMLENITAIGSDPSRYPGGQFLAMRLEGITCAT